MKATSRQIGSEKVRELEPQEQAFVDALTSEPWPTVADAGEMAGYTRQYAYKLHNKPHIQAALDRRADELERENKLAVQRVMKRLEARSERTDNVGNEAAKLFLEANGRVGRGANITVSATANTDSGGETLAERFARIRSERINEPSKS